MEWSVIFNTFLKMIFFLVYIGLIVYAFSLFRRFVLAVEEIAKKIGKK